MNGPADDRISGLLEELVRWQRAAALPAVRSIAREALSDERRRRVYDAADGSRTVRELAEIGGASRSAISQWSATWRALGIADLSPKGQLRHLAPLAALGLDSPSNGPATGDGET
jgi:hypothetical protein